MYLKKRTALACVFATVAISMTTPAFALDTESKRVEPPVNQLENLSAGTLLAKRDVAKIIETNIQGYLKSDEQTKGKKITASSDYINLYDLDSHLFAYMVPLLEHGKEIGYITVGALEDGFSTYEINIDDVALQKIKSKLAEGNAQLVFLPPFRYIAKTADSQKEQYLELSNKQFADITDHVQRNKTEIQKNYRTIRKIENRSVINKLLQNTNTIAEGGAYATVATEDVRLVKEAQGDFVPVYTGSSYSYGGDQIWYSTTTKQDRGCGPVAAANITQYLAQSNPSKYGKLYSPSSMSKSDFLTHMDSLYTAISPGLFGETSVLDFTSKVESYASGKGVPLKRVTSSASFTLDNTATYIKNGLYANAPVATLNTIKSSDYEYSWHWMTITKYFRDSADNRWIAVSTWGERRSIDYRVHFDAMLNGWVTGGLMWFQ